jgi:hypothetical protein
MPCSKYIASTFGQDNQKADRKQMTSFTPVKYVLERRRRGVREK